jgi:predicted DNA-binding protein YlxM (UPF0122 family)
MEYIRLHEGETLIKLYPDLQGMAKSIRAQMKSIVNSGDIDDTIYSMSLSHPTTDDVPSFSLGSVNDKTGRIALEFETKLSHELQSSLRELRSELLLVEVVLDKLDISLSALTKDQREIIELKYWEGFVWSEIAGKFLVSESNVKGQRKRAIERICNVSRITLETYEGIMRLFNFEENGGEDMADRQSPYWSKGTKRLIDKAIKLGYRFTVQTGTIEMVYEGKNEPPFEKVISPIKYAIKTNKSAVLEYLKHLEKMRMGGELIEVENL